MWFGAPSRLPPGGSPSACTVLTDSMPRPLPSRRPGNKCRHRGRCGCGRLNTACLTLMYNCMLNYALFCTYISYAQSVHSSVHFLHNDVQFVHNYVRYNVTETSHTVAAWTTYGFESGTLLCLSLHRIHISSLCRCAPGARRPGPLPVPVRLPSWQMCICLAAPLANGHRPPGAGSWARRDAARDEARVKRVLRDAVGCSMMARRSPRFAQTFVSDPQQCYSRHSLAQAY